MIRLTVRDAHGQLLVQGDYEVTHKELSISATRRPDVITICARDAQDRSASISIPVDVLEFVAPADAPLDGRAHSRRSEDRVLAANRL